MKLVLFEAGSGPTPGLLVDGGVVSAASVVEARHSPQATMEGLIDNFEALRPRLDELAKTATPAPPDSVRLLPPLPRPGKILNCIGNYWEHAQREPRQLNMFLKNPDAVVGDGGTIRLPEFTEPWMFMHEAELAIVLRGPSKVVKSDDWRTAVFGYTCLIDVSARGEGRSTWKQGSWLGKSFDTFAPIGPCIATADEIPDPNDLHVQFWDNGQLRHNYLTDDMEHRVPELIEFATTVMTLNSGDLISCGTNHEGLGPLQDGEHIEIEIHGIGKMALDVVDPLGRSWERGIYMGADSTNHDAVLRPPPGERPPFDTDAEHLRGGLPRAAPGGVAVSATGDRAAGSRPEHPVRLAVRQSGVDGELRQLAAGQGALHHLGESLVALPPLLHICAYLDDALIGHVGLVLSSGAPRRLRPMTSFQPASDTCSCPREHRGYGLRRRSSCARPSPTS